MAAITSYSALKAAAQQWLNRKDQSIIDAIPLCISFAEQDFQRLFRLPHNETSTEYDVPAPLADTTTGELLPNYVSLPTNCYEVKHLAINGRPYSRVSVEIFNRLKSGDIAKSTTNGLTETNYTGSTEDQYYFARVGDSLRTIPGLVEGDAVQFIYYNTIKEMVNDGDFPESLKAAPDVMLYLTLRHASLFLRDTDQAQFWEQKANDAGIRLMQRYDEIEWAGSSITVPQFSK